jgi:3',5'-cyclic AMP phosphodiesterase CpdA
MFNRSPLSRRSMLGLAGGLLGISQAPFFSRADGAPTAPAADGSFSFAHLTDIHVTPKLRATEGLRLCVQAVNALPQSTAFVLTGGDLIMDALEEESSYVREQWACFDDAMGALRLPAHHTIGNHDIGGWSHKARIHKNAPEYGKAYFSEKYGKGSTYRSFDHGGWHFIILDSVALDEASGDYYGWIDDAQLEWLKADLAKTGKQTPIIVSTHIPFVSVWGQLNADPRRGEGPKGLINNGYIVRKVLGGFNVKLVLCGHGHVSERIELSHHNRTTFIQGGAVCGLWWKGKVAGNPEGFGVVTCSPDGSFTYEYRDYGWMA